MFVKNQQYHLKRSWNINYLLDEHLIERVEKVPRIKYKNDDVKRTFVMQRYHLYIACKWWTLTLSKVEKIVLNIYHIVSYKSKWINVTPNILLL